MSASKNLIQASAGVGGGIEPFYDYEIENSARFTGSETLYRAQTSPTNNKKWTFSCWFKYIGPTGWQGILGAGSSPYYTNFYMNSNHFLLNGYGPGSYGQMDNTAFYRDSSAWYHVVVAFDSTQASAGDRQKIWVNGVLEASPYSYGAWPLNHNTYINQSGRTLFVGRSGETASYSKQYLAECVFIDGQQLDPTNFAETKNGVWVPKEITGLTFGNNGFYLDFANSGALGTDVSGNGNNLTSSGFTSSDQMVDTPTNNFATLNPLLQFEAPAGYPGAMYNGNLEKEGPASNSYTGSYSTIAMPPNTGKWYSEHYVVTENRNAFGISYALDAGFSAPGYSTTYGYYLFCYSGWGYSNLYSTASTVVEQVTNLSAGGIVGILYDSDNSEVTFFVNGTQAGSTMSVPSATYLFFADGYGVSPKAYNVSNFGQDSTFGGRITTGGNTDANGLGDFKYTVPTDALALCTANLPEPTIGPNSATLSDEHFDTALWTGNGGTTTVSSLNFQPDFTWIKSRTYARYHALADVLRGYTKFLTSNTTSAEDTVDSGNGVVWNSTGFEVDASSDWNSLNESGADIVAWNWKANGSGVSNTVGSIPSTVSANTTAGFSVVTWAGTGASGATIGHGLGAVPQFVVTKARTSSTYSWHTWHTSLGTNYYVSLNTDSPQDNSVNIFPTAGMTSTTFQTATSAIKYNNLSGVNYVAYCFAEVEGFSSFGKYTGNGSADGPFVYTGFRPAFVMTKRTDTSGYGWVVMDAGRDQYNVADAWLYADSSSAEVSNSSTRIDFLSNGFKLRGDSSTQNASGGTYIYMAFAETPFKYSNAR